MFERIAGPADAQLPLNGPCANQSLDTPIANRALQLLHRVDTDFSRLK
jgi:hypothetical protein